MSADCLARLEPGLGPQPSEQIIGAINRGLRLSLDERDHLLLRAGHLAPVRPGAGDHVSPGLMRILDRLTDIPAQVMGPLRETLAQNATAIALFSDESRYTGLARSAAYRWFTDPATRSLIRPRIMNITVGSQVSQLDGALARLGPRSAAAELVDRLQGHSPEFASLWGRMRSDFETRKRSGPSPRGG